MGEWMGVNLGSAYGEIVIDTDGAQRSIDGLAASMRSSGQMLSLGVTAPLVALGAVALTSAGDFEQSMNIMAQVSGATAEEMAMLEEQALALGESTVFGAGDAADAMLELSKAGLTAQEVSDSIAGVLDLAAAGGIDLASAATIAAGALNAFNLPAKSTATVANTLAAAANASSADIGDLAMGFQMAAAVFSSNGQTVDDLAASLGILANNGIRGSDAGTSLKTMLMRLAAPTGEAAGLMEELGLNVYDAQGQMLGFGDIVAQLESATSGLNDAQRNAALTTIFGADAIRAATILASEGSASFDAMSTAVGQQGAAAETAGARMSGLNGALETMKGSFESLMIQMSGPFLESLTGMVLAVAGAVTAFGNLPEPARNAALAFLAVAAAAGPAMLLITGIGAAVGFLVSPIGLTILAVGLLAAAWASNFGNIQGITATAVATITPYFAQLQTAAGEASGVIAQGWTQLATLLAPAIARVQEAFAGMGAQFAALGPEFTELQTALTTLWQTVAPILLMLGQMLAATFGAITVLLVNNFAAVIGGLAPTFGLMISQVTVFITMLNTTITGMVNLVTALIAGDWTAAWAAGKSIIDGFVKFTGDSLNNLLSLAALVIGGVKNVVLKTLEDLGVKIQPILNGIKAFWDSIWGGLTGTVNAVAEGVQSVWDNLVGFKDWLATAVFVNPLAGWSLPDIGGWLNGGRAGGSSWAPGGLTLVGERGPELVVMPPGAEVMTNGQSNRFSGGGGGAPVVNVTINGVRIDNERDLQRQAYRVAGMIAAGLA
jgi:TP901 family phage tail tape measure protein